MMTSRRRIVALLALTLTWTPATFPTSAADDIPSPHINAGLTPQQAAKAMTTREGFRVELVAGEPDVHQPIAFTIDHRGRLWVAEAHTYPRRAADGEGQDKIIILEDRDHDGRFETRKLFADGLNLVSGLELGFGGVWVGAAPYLLFIPDRDGDDHPDGDPEILLDGFGYQDTHETLNSFIWGPDGWLYGCHGVFTHSHVGKPGTPPEARVPMNAAVWRYHPTRHQFEVFCWGTSNPWGVDFNDYGQPFITACVIPHLWHVIQGARYHRQGGQHFNPHVYDDIKTIAEHRHYVGDIRDHAWWGREPEAPADTLAAGGGHAHCGTMIYLADNWPAEHRNQVFMHNVHGNRINNDLLKRKGSGYVGRRGPDLMLANDKWFRGINLKYGPDGSVYLIDWYDRNACHRTNPEIWDRTNGRIYNLAYGEPEIEAVDLAQLNDLELVQLQLHKNDWFVRMSRRILQDRAARGLLQNAVAVRHRLRAILQPDGGDPAGRLRAMWTLHAIGELDDELRTSLLTDANEYVRCWAIQLGLEDRQISDQELTTLAEMAARDSSAIVRLYLASALQRLELEQRWEIAAGLVQHHEDADDHNLPLMIWYGVEPLVPHNPGKAMKLARQSRIPLVSRYIVRRAASSPATLEVVTSILSRTGQPEAQQAILDEMLMAFEGRADITMPASWAPVYRRLVASPSEAVRERADQLAILMGDERVYPRVRELLTNQDAPLDKRRDALKTLVRGQDRDAAKAFQAVLSEPELRPDAIRALALTDDPTTPQAILDLYSALNSQEKRAAIGTLTTRAMYSSALLDAIENGHVPRTDLHAYNVRQILSLDNAALNERLREVWGEIRESTADKRDQIQRYREICTPDRLKNANLGNGRAIFATTCANCHRLFGVGEQVGPDITGSNRTNLDYILENIIDPSAVLGKDYRMTVLELADGRVVSGLVQRETDSAITVRTLNDTVVVPRSQIDARQLSPLSMMPEGLLDRMKPDQVVDLIAYLGSPTQVPLRGPAAPIDKDSGRVTDALEGESLKIVGKTAGHTQTQAMNQFAADQWSGNAQLWWTGAQPQDRLEVALPVASTGHYHVELVLTRAPDYAIVQITLDGQPLGDPIDLYAPNVLTTGVLTFENQSLSAGVHKLGFEILGANPQAAKAYMVGIDYVRLAKGEE